MPVLWSNDLATGVDKVDDQHKELFARINRLLDACMSGKGVDEVNNTLDFLMRYVVEHFETEEAAMRRAHYAGYDVHRRLHANFRAEVEKMAHEIRAEGIGRAAVVKVNQTVVAWLNDHIRKADRVMAQALREVFAAGRSAG